MSIKMKNKFLIIGAILFTFNLQSQEISDTSFGKGLINFTAKDSTFSTSFSSKINVFMGSQW